MLANTVPGGKFCLVFWFEIVAEMLLNPGLHGIDIGCGFSSTKRCYRALENHFRG